MIATISGIFMENKIVVRKDGSEIPQAVIYSDGEVVNVNNLNVTTKKPFEPIQTTVRVLNGQYGLYVTAV